MRKKIRVLVACPAPEDGTSFYRGMGPFNQLAKQFDHIEVTEGGMNTKDYTWDKIGGFDVLFFQRPTVPSHLQIIEEAIKNHIPVWIDYDDDLLAVPKDNPTYPLYSDPKNRMAIVECLKRANLVSVSTQKIKDTYSQFTQAIQVIPNAWNDFMFAPRPFPKIKDRKKVILWRGSSTHTGDLLHYSDQILRIHNHFTDWKWFFLGYEPYFITDKMRPDAFGVAPFAGHMDYFNLLQTLAAPIHIVPLPKTQFNESKSNIAWIEGSLAGSAVVCPDFDSWQYPGAITCGEKGVKSSFVEGILQSIEQIETLDVYQEQSWATIQERLRLSEVNKLRKVCIEKLLSFSETFRESFGIKTILKHDLNDTEIPPTPVSPESALMMNA